MSARAGVVWMLTVAVISECAPDTSSTWMRTQPPQTLHGLMVSIDERLQTLQSSRWELTLKQAEQRLDSLESTVRRLDSTLHERLDKLERNFNSKELKDELTVEKLTHKIRDVMDSSYDRYNRRLGYTEEKLEMVLKKIQMTTEASLNRIEKQQEDVQTEMLEAVTLLEDLKGQTSTTEDKLNHTHKAIQQHIQRLISPSQEELQRISGSLDLLGSRLNSSLAVGPWGSQSDGPPPPDIITSLRREISLEGTKITSKINNMYNDLWRRVISVEALVKDLNRATNTTHREVLEEVRSLAMMDNREFPGDSQENFLEVALDALERKLQRRLLDLGRKLDDRLDTLSATQNLVMDSCFDGGICHGLESRLSQVLEKIFDVFSERIEGFSNRTLDLDGLVMEMMELVKSQHSQLIRTVTHNTNMVVTLAKDSSDANKLLHHTVSQLADKTNNKFQELQTEISNSTGKNCLEREIPHEEILDKQLISKNTSENPVVSTTTESVVTLLNISEPKNKTGHLDTGVLKITTDDIVPLADNSSMASESVIKPVIINPSHPLTLDFSILQVIELMLSNLTQTQKDTLMRFLNNTISLDNLEAVIQNTEADPDYETSGEIYDSETLNKKGIEEEFSTAINNQAITVASDISFEAENISDENGDDLVQNKSVVVETVATVNATTTGEARNYTDEKQSNNAKSQEISEELKTQLKYYALIMKIKQDKLNISQFWTPNQQENNITDVTNQSNIIPIIEKLCYGEENTHSFASDRTNSKMRERLILLDKTIKDKELYEKIENICNTMTESLTTDDKQEEILPND